ncbi:lysine--tRNA ligase [Limnochorda pilosa]|uniref:Lysine--tRNA ligase n=1 Tax=Limnochorda pilosa TaxID=1555112 RepID=A0A0K2SPD5_LIMPI|nr:lysine--tRNA ligase [Limnochorda pilosa]BAS28966.1 lysyl-tRNA synthetase [Limnochorda pilosa]
MPGTADEATLNRGKPSALGVDEQRAAKLESLRARGVEVYAGAYPRSHAVSELLQRFDELQGSRCRLAGRLMARRTHGKVSFADLRDESGTIQLYLRAERMGEAAYGLWADLDVGDIVGAEGDLVRTRRGEVSLEVDRLVLLTKSLAPLPDKWHGLRDVEVRYRQRYVDLVVSPEVKEVFRKRSLILTGMRRFLVERGYLEVETPILHPIPGGANARPFVTFHNALQAELYLRVAPELYLKRLLVGGFEKVFEIGKNFRNEGVSTTHNPEYTSMECYLAYGDAEAMMQLTEQMVAVLAEEVCGSRQVAFGGRTYDLTPPWPRLPMIEAVRQSTGVDLRHATPEEARRRAAEVGVEVPPGASVGHVVSELFERRVADTLQGPVFIVDFPVEVSPLARRKDGTPEWVDRFEPYVAGWEIGNGFSELTDALDQAARFRRQAEARARGDEEAQFFDEDFVHALEVGMPPAGGLGIGVDRLVMFLTGQTSIRDVLLFPHLRPLGRLDRPAEPS